MSMIWGLFNNVFLAVAAYFLFKNSKAQGLLRTVLFFSLCYIVIFEIVSLFNPVQNVLLQLIDIVAEFVFFVFIIVPLISASTKNFLGKFKKG